MWVFFSLEMFSYKKEKRTKKDSSVVERSLMARWIIGSIPNGGHTELLIVPSLV